MQKPILHKLIMLERVKALMMGRLDVFIFFTGELFLFFFLSFVLRLLFFLSSFLLNCFGL